MKTIRHIIVITAGTFILLGVPFLTSDYFRGILNGGTDAVSGASVTVDKPSGEYDVIINLDKHTDSENLSLWRDFFSGEDVSFIFEDIKCTSAKGDAGGIQLAENYMTRLPENQMILKTEDPTLMLSKAEYGKFDVIVISREIADIYKASSVYDMDNIEVIHVRGESE
ncbi:MAG: hypothetical protein IJ666_00915 [Ruminococcus sp.]|nr:hypothetical protein [Ruminococcus sp.]